MSDTIEVLFVCVHKAARSRMAEALLWKLGGPRFEVASAGFEPTGVNPLVLEALAQAGIPLPPPGPQPSVFDLFKADRHFHYVISVCDEGIGQKWPVFPGVTRRLSWSFRDPAMFTGTREEKLAQVIEIRDALRDQVGPWLRSFPTDPTAGPWSAPERTNA